MDSYFQNTFLFISKYKKNLLPLLKQLQWAEKYRVERLDTILTRLGLFANTFRDSYHHLVTGYDLYEHTETKEYILRVQTESNGDTLSIDLERCKLYLGHRIKLEYLSENSEQSLYINTDTSNVYLPMRFKVELYMNESYVTNYFPNLFMLQRFISATFPMLQVDIFDTYKTVRNKVNRYIKALNTNNWCHIASYQN